MACSPRNALIGQGLRVSVYEQASALGEVGAGVFVTPNAVRHLSVWSGPASRNGRAGRSGLLVRHDGTPIARCRCRTHPAERDLCMHRRAVISSLPTCPPRSSIPATVLSAEQNGDVARVKLPRRHRQADVVVAADGIPRTAAVRLFTALEARLHGTISTEV